MFEQGKFGKTETTQSPNLKLRDEVFNRINDRLKNVRDAGVDSKNILVPIVENDSDSLTRDFLQKTGLLNNISIIVAADSQHRVNVNKVTVSGYEGGYFGKKHVFLNVARLFSDSRPIELFGSRDGNSYSSVSNVTLYEKSLGVLGPISGSEENVLLLYFLSDGFTALEVSSLTLPRNWRQAIKDGKLINEAEAVRKNNMANIELTDEARMMMERIEKPGDNTRVFFEMTDKLKKFPDIQNVMVEGKKGLKDAKFGENKTPVEIKLEPDKITLTFGEFDFEQFKRFVLDGNLNVNTLAKCLKSSSNHNDRLVLEASLGISSGLKVKGEILRWDAGKGCLVSSLPYLCAWWEQYSEAIGSVLNDPLKMFPFFFGQLKAPKEQVSEVKSWSNSSRDNFFDKYSRDRANYRMGISTPYPFSSHGFLYPDYTPSRVGTSAVSHSVVRFYERDPAVIAQEKKKYWSEKAQKRNKKKKVK